MVRAATVTNGAILLLGFLSAYVNGGDGFLKKLLPATLHC